MTVIEKSNELVKSMGLHNAELFIEQQLKCRMTKKTFPKRFWEDVLEQILKTNK